MIVQTDDNVTLLAAGDVSAADLDEALTLAPILVAADGAAGQALAAGLRPRAVIGDLDSIDAATRAAIPEENLHLVAEQDSTDFDKCLRSIDAPLVLGLGLTGGRLDHELAAYSVLLERAERRCILVGAVDLCFLCPPLLRMEPPPGSRFSLFPLAPVRGRSQGLRWPIDGLPLAAGGRIATSNEVTGPVRVEVEAPGLLAIMPKAELRPAMAALRAAPGWGCRGG